MFCALKDLVTESDVEQKLLWPLLTPGEDLQTALGEARLYGNELNALFPSGTNPCARVVASNGSELWSSPLDTSDPDIRLMNMTGSCAQS